MADPSPSHLDLSALESLALGSRLPDPRPGGRAQVTRTTSCRSSSSSASPTCSTMRSTAWARSTATRVSPRRWLRTTTAWCGSTSRRSALAAPAKTLHRPGRSPDDAVRAVSRENPRLSGVIDVTDFNATTAGQRIIDDEHLHALVQVLQPSTAWDCTTSSRTSWAGRTSTCCASLPKARGRAPASSTPRAWWAC